MAKKLVIFDLDGTLLNTITDLGNAANYALSQMGYPTHHLSSYPHFVGGGITSLLKQVIPATEMNENNIAKLRTLFVEHYNKHLTDTTLPYPGVPELLKQLTDRGIKVAVASNKYNDATQTLVKHFFGDIAWSAIEGQKSGIPVKPDPSMIFSILSENPTPKSEVTYIGDSATDIITGKRAGVDTISVTWGFRPVSELVAAYAENIVDSPQQIVDLLDKQ